MRRAIAWVGSAVLPIAVAAPTFRHLAQGARELDGWWTLAGLVLPPAAIANAIAAWAVALRRNASPPRDTWGALARAAGCFALALPIYFVAVVLAALMSGEEAASAGVMGVVAFMQAFFIGTVPMIALQWLLFHFTLPHATA